MTICVGLYIAEISTPQDRGTFLSLITPSINLGLLLVYTLGAFLPWQNVAWIFAAYSLMVLYFFNYIPESHIWFMLRERQSEAVGVLQRLRKDRPLESVNAELEEIRIRLTRHKRKTGGEYWRNFTSPAAWKPFLLFTIFSFLQQQAGYNIIMFRAVEFLAKLQSNGPKFDGYKLAIIFACISLIGSALLVFIVHKFNRVTLLTFSGICMAGSLTAAAIYRGFNDADPINWIPFVSPISFSVLCVFLYTFFCMLGMIDIPYMMIGEILPNHLRGVMSAMISVVIFVMQFVNVGSYQFLLNNLGMTGLLILFAAFSCSSVMFAKIFFPETKGKALTEIEEVFDKSEYDRIHLKEGCRRDAKDDVLPL